MKHGSLRRHILPAIPLVLGLVAQSASARTTRSDSVMEPLRSLETFLEAPEPIPSTRGGIRDFPFRSDLRDPGDVSLTGLWTGRVLTFGVPEHWRLKGQPELHLDVMRSAQLIPEISAITVWADAQPIGTFLLDGPPNEIWREVLKLPLQIPAGGHSLQFNAYHRSWMPCELADHPGLWSRLLGTSFLRMAFTEVPPELSLARWPYPFLDPWDPYPSRVVLVLPERPDAEMLAAAARVAGALGQAAGPRRLDLITHLGPLASAPAGHAILFSRAANDETDAASAGLGTLILAPRPGQPLSALLTVRGGNLVGVGALGSLLAHDALYDLPAGTLERVTRVDPLGSARERRWVGVAPPENKFSLTDLGYLDQTARGFRGGSVFFVLDRIPDEIPVANEVFLRLVYSYAGQISPTNSRLDVLVDGVAIGGAVLGREEGESRKTLEIPLPAHALGPRSLVEVRFELVGKEDPVCLGESHDELWGTVHADSVVLMPRTRVPRINDLALLRYGGYPFGLRPDLSELLFVLPDAPRAEEVQTLAWFAGELGRVVRGDRLAFDVRLGGLAEGDRERDLLVVEAGRDPVLLRALGLLEPMWLGRGDEGGRLVDLRLGTGARVGMVHEAEVAWIEELPLPWSEDRTALVVWAPEARLFERVGRCPGQTPLFDRLGGRVSRVAACDDVAFVSGMAPEATPPQVAVAEQAAEVKSRVRPWWSWLLLGVGGACLLMVLAFFGWWLRMRSRRPYEQGPWSEAP